MILGPTGYDLGFRLVVALTNFASFYQLNGWWKEHQDLERVRADLYVEMSLPVEHVSACLGHLAVAYEACKKFCSAVHLYNYLLSDFATDHTKRMEYGFSVAQAHCLNGSLDEAEQALFLAAIRKSSQRSAEQQAISLVDVNSECSLPAQRLHVLFVCWRTCDRNEDHSVHHVPRYSGSNFESISARY